MAVDPFKGNRNYGTQVTDAKAAKAVPAGVFVGYPYEAVIVGDGVAATLSGSNDVAIVAGVPTLKGSPTWTAIATLTGTTPIRLTRVNYAFLKVDAGSAMVHQHELNTAAGNVTPVP